MIEKTIPNSLVYGGRATITSQRTVESAFELEPVDEEVTEAYLTLIKACETLDSLRLILEHMSENGINIEGSRGYVYVSLYQASNITLERPPLNYFTRGMGIRAKVAELRGEEL